MFAHRGLAFAPDGAQGAPENTLLAFSAAAAVGVDYIETDVHASKDGVAVVSHDPSLRRVAGLDARVADLTLAQLQRTQLGADQVFVSLEDALDAFPLIRFNIDVKSADAVVATITAIRRTRAERRVLLTSFSEARRLAVVREVPGVATSVGASRFARALAAAKLRSPALLARVLAGVDAVQVPTHYGPMSITTPTMVELFHTAGVEVHVWTINDETQMNALLDAGVDGLVTDRADLAMAVLSRRS